MMNHVRRIVLLLLAALAGLSVQAQERPYKWTIGIGPTIRDFTGIPNKNLEQMTFTPAMHLQFGRSLGSSLEAVLQTTFPASTFATSNDSTSLSEADVHIRYKFANGYILKETSTIAPYLHLGVNGNMYDWANPIFNMGVPFGAGFRVNWRSWGLDFNASYKANQTDFRDYFSVNGSLNLLIGGNRTPPPPPPNPDSDGDGIDDMLDNCPNTFGVASLQGCPDRDGDGVADDSDNCPDTPGTKELAGCPDDDADDDGIPDEEDDCPQTAGLASLNGCPDRDNDNVADHKDDCPNEAGLVELNGCPDRDGDGIRDEEDICPDEAGVPELKGCPEIEDEVKEKLAFATKAVQFESASAILKTVSYAVLDTIVTIMEDYPEYSLRASGHTDSQGEADKNQDLSEARAKACMEYIISKGIAEERLVHIGYGESRPIADNINRAGRAINRRVEFELFIK
ncbi:MAG: OmpA family protein [Bacteroidota bacterium]